MIYKNIKLGRQPASCNLLFISSSKIVRRVDGGRKVIDQRLKKG